MALPPHVGRNWAGPNHTIFYVGSVRDKWESAREELRLAAQKLLDRAGVGLCDRLLRVRVRREGGFGGVGEEDRLAQCARHLARSESTRHGRAKQDQVLVRA